MRTLIAAVSVDILWYFYPKPYRIKKPSSWFYVYLKEQINGYYRILLLENKGKMFLYASRPYNTVTQSHGKAERGSLQL